MLSNAQGILIVRTKGGAVMHITTLGSMWRRMCFKLYEVDAQGRAGLSRRVKRDQLLRTVAICHPM